MTKRERKTVTMARLGTCASSRLVHSVAWCLLSPPSSSLSSRSYPLQNLAKPSEGWQSRRGRCFTTTTTKRPPLIVMQATEQQEGQIKEEEIVDNKILPYCSIDTKGEKRTLGELEQDFLEALQSFYFEKKSVMTNEEFDNLKEELMWQGSSVVMLSPDEQKFMEASLAYAVGKSIMTDAEYDELKLRLKKASSKVALEGPRCSIRSRNVYSDLTVDYFKMFLLNVPAAIVALTLVFFLDDFTGFEITYLLELPEPYSFIFTWFVVLPATYFIARAITNAILKDFLILKGPCPNCGTENISFFGTILTVPSGGPLNEVKCENCGTALMYNSDTRLITLDEKKQEGSQDSKPKKTATTASAP